MTNHTEFNRAQASAAFAAESWDTATFWDAVAFVQRYGTAAELDARGRELYGLSEWWARRGPHVSGEDRDAIEGLGVALEQIMWLHATADVIEEQLKRAGYVFDTKSRLIREIAEGRRGRKRTLLRDSVVAEFDRLGGERNTAEIRETIRQILSDRFHPDHLGPHVGEPIHSAINAALNP